MFSKIKSLFQKKNKTDLDCTDINIACAILLIEVSHADFDISQIELNSILDSLVKKFKINDEDAKKLLVKAMDRHDKVSSLRDYIKQINENFTRDQKIKIIESAWDVAKADDNIDKYEEHRIRKLTELLHLSHTDFIKSKLK
jgi:uncharacterized tellurite resistance protein B-like protein